MRALRVHRGVVCLTDSGADLTTSEPVEDRDGLGRTERGVEGGNRRRRPGRGDADDGAGEAMLEDRGKVVRLHRADESEIAWASTNPLASDAIRRLVADKQAQGWSSPTSAAGR